MGAHRGKTAAVVTALTLVLVLGAGALYWKEFIIQYHLRHLRKDPAHALGINPNHQNLTGNG